jgi:tRNA A37 threonylcarbamoyladenosine modification protein TsaB
VYVPTDKLVIVLPKLPLSQFIVYGDVPPVTIKVIVPSEEVNVLGSVTSQVAPIVNIVKTLHSLTPSSPHSNFLGGFYVGVGVGVFVGVGVGVVVRVGVIVGLGVGVGV